MSIQLILAWIVPAVVVIGALVLIVMDQVANLDPVVPGLPARIDQYETLIDDTPWGG